MGKYILKKKLFAVVFLIAVYAFSAVNLVHSLEPLKEFLISSRQEGSFSVAALETEINENLYQKMNFIETYALAQVLMDKREYNNFSSIKDEDGFLHYASFFREDDNRIFEYAMRVKRLKDYAEKKGTRVLFAVAPSKYIPGVTRLRKGLPPNDPNPTVDELLFYLNRLGVEVLDYRETIPNQKVDYQASFFRTDHHWTIPAAFDAAVQLVEKIRDAFGEDLDPEHYYTDISNYTAVTYKKQMLGSMARKTGAVFCGLEDFTALWPRFEGDFERKCYVGDVWSEYEGSFEQALMDKEILTDRHDIYSDSLYSLYLDGLSNYEHIVNRENLDGSSFFFIRDSYFSPVMSFLMPMCGKIEAVWSLEETEELDIEAIIRENTYDYIVIEVYPYNIESLAFNYFKEEKNGK